MFSIVGTGVAFDLTINSLEALRRCDEIYLERYTSPIAQEKIKELEQRTGKQIILLEREKVESDFLIVRATKARIALLAPGDPLTATTHITLLVDAKNRGIETKVFHNSSIYSAAPGAAGLQIYRFGKSATLVNPRERYKPTSSLDMIRANLELNVHSLVLLDTEPEPMEANTALQMLSEFESAVILSKVGEDGEKITYGSIEELKKTDLGKPPFTIIIPARLHVMEEEYLNFHKVII